jgi:hypothetical protein
VKNVNFHPAVASIKPPAATWFCVTSLKIQITTPGELGLVKPYQHMPREWGLRAAIEH